MKKIFFRLEAVATLIGAVVGLGIFAIPYAVKDVGIGPTIVLTIFVGLIMTFISLAFAEVVIFSGEKKHLIGYAKEHLGDWGGRVQTFSIVFGYGGALLAYLLAGTVFLQTLIPGGEKYFLEIAVGFAIINGLVLLRNVISLGFLELVLMFFLILIFITLFFLGIPHWQETPTSWDKILLPYGVIWFALSGMSSVPVIAKIMKGQEKNIKGVIVAAYIIVFLLALSFVLTVIKVGGGKVSLDPFLTLGESLGQWVVLFGTVIGIVAVASSYWVIGTFLKNSLIIDLKLSKIVSWAVVVFFPLFFLVIGVSNFVEVIALIGIIFGTIDAIIILLMYKAIFINKKKKGKIFSFKLPIWILFLTLTIICIAAASSLIF